ncbi:membrane hypothetical protein [Vibrio crassostreae]|nr:membrane hypothetical protein [Vibrio crassostreae]CAK3798273.1 membrane hypothetical protein [Vibrio crassostreae]
MISEGRIKKKVLVSMLSVALLQSIFVKFIPLLMLEMGYDYTTFNLVKSSEYIPLIFFSLFAGVLVDTQSQKNITILSISLMILGTLIGYIAYTSVDESGHLFMLAMISIASGLSLYYLHIFKIVKNNINEQELSSFHSILTSSTYMVSMLGPIISGVLISNGQIDLAFLTFLIFCVTSLLLLNGLCEGEQKYESEGEKQGFYSDFIDGVKCFKKNKSIVNLTVLVMFTNAVDAVCDANYYFIAKDYFDMSADKIGFLFSFSAVMAIVGSALSYKIFNKLSFENAAQALLMLNVFGYVLVYIYRSEVSLLIVIAIESATTAAFVVGVRTERLKLSPTEHVGRIAAISGASFKILMPVSLYFHSAYISKDNLFLVFSIVAVITLVALVIYTMVNRSYVQEERQETRQ